MSRIPMRPSDRSACGGLKEDEMNMLTYYVLSGCTKEYALEHFKMSDFKMTKAAIVKLSTQFFSSPTAKNYIAAYRDTLDKFLEKDEGDGTAKPDALDGMTAEAINKRKVKAVQKIVEYILEEANHIQDAADPEMLVKIADKVGLFDDFEKAVEAPRRYLPVDRCHDCRYYKFCTSDDVVDECKLCRYKEYAEKKGVKYTHATMLRKEKEA